MHARKPVIMEICFPRKHVIESVGIRLQCMAYLYRIVLIH